MSPCLVLDESSWANASSLTKAVVDAMELLSERLQVATEQRVPVYRHRYFYEAPAGSNLEIISDVLFGPALDRDLALRLQHAIDRAALFDDAQLISFDASILGAPAFTPGISWAHVMAGVNQAVGVLPLPVHSNLAGELRVTVEGVVRRLHFVTSCPEHIGFFRAAIVFEKMGHEKFRAVAPSAFPALEWLDSVWNELRVHKSHFFGQYLTTFVHHLTVLNDQAAQFFHDDPGHVDKRFDAAGVDASSENGNARSYSPSVKDRTRNYRGHPEVFWWHTKITFNAGRIHFLHVPKAADASDFSRATYGHIVIGICKKHCILPD